MVEAGLHADAETLLRDVLAIREQKIPNTWQAANAKALVGIALAGQKRDAEAEPLLTAGYDGLKAHRKDIPPQGAENLPRAGRALALLYERTGRAEKAATIRAELPPQQRPQSGVRKP